MEYNDDYFYDLVQKKLAGNANLDEENYIHEVLSRYPQARELYDDLVAMHEDKNFQEYLKSPDYVHSKQQLMNRILHAEHQHQKRKSWLLAAAVIATFAITASVYFFLSYQKSSTEILVGNQITLQLADGKQIKLPTSSNSGPVSLTAAGAILRADSTTLNFTAIETGSANTWNTLTVPIGKTYSIVLEDSTIVHLNAASKVQFPFAFTGHTREIMVDGEAYINVTQKSNHSFIVYTPHSIIEVLGTQFNVNTYDSGVVRVALVKGALRVKGENQQVTIHPGQEAIYEAGRGMTVQYFEEDIRIGWLKGLYYFENQKLEDIAVVIKRWYGVDVVFDNAALGKKTFQGVLDKNKSLSTFLTNLTSAGFSNGLEMEYYYENAVLHIRQKVEK
ncbi:FecR domain-containing protein [uncultured Chitinophaga sp.]|jgi:Fe2+-dicitrate sensor, membrane component|uniref:FecR family protein n=1 Tax=uncultured Chitinophaga sp. TaxID=339340 RepID=UPI002602C30E|nr:FecR domain-containing protein [uncultured Chitinophaga sp.]